MATLGLIGSGHIGGTLARLAVDAGLDVVLSNSRGPQTLSDLVDELGPQARAATPAARRSSTPATTIPRVTAPSRNSKRRSSPIAKCSSGTWPRRTS